MFWASFSLSPTTFVFLIFSDRGGGGVMGGSVALLMKILYPQWRIRLLEQFDKVGAESSNEWRNAGTGHAALCEPNYTPLNKATGEVLTPATAVLDPQPQTERKS